MKIWLINNYNMLPEHGSLNRSYYLAKYLKRLGHEPTVFVGSHPHNTGLQLIEDNQQYKVYQDKPFPWVLVKTRNYEGSRKSRALSMFEFYRNMKEAAKHFDKPDAIIGSSAHPLAALAAIKLGKKYGCKGIMEVRDLWPESIVAYGILSRNNPVVKLLYGFEKYLYTHADSVIFTMENAYQYILDQKLDRVIPREKVFYLNNGVDLEEFENNKNTYRTEDEDLDNKDLFKVVYTGAIRRVNNLGLLLDAAKHIKNKKVKLLIWGDGDELPELRKRVLNEGIENVVFKGSTGKRYIPGIVSKADANFAHNEFTSVFKYGISFNKLFDYLAAGKPVLFDFDSPANPAVRADAGISCGTNDAAAIAEMIDRVSMFDRETLETIAQKVKAVAEEYSYANLSEKLVAIIENTPSKEKQK
jgi:glycosyltransferase involved in cell wall biosynthesis